MQEIQIQQLQIIKTPIREILHIIMTVLTFWNFIIFRVTVLTQNFKHCFLPLKLLNLRKKYFSMHVGVLLYIMSPIRTLFETPRILVSLP